MRQQLHRLESRCEDGDQMELKPELY